MTLEEIRKVEYDENTDIKEDMNNAKITVGSVLAGSFLISLLYVLMTFYALYLTIYEARSGTHPMIILVALLLCLSGHAWLALLLFWVFGRSQAAWTFLISVLGVMVFMMGSVIFGIVSM